MPIAELGYRSWEGRRVSAWFRWLAITRSQVAIALRNNRLLRRFLFFAWVPALWSGWIFFAIGYLADPANDLTQGGPLAEFGQEVLLPTELIAQIREKPDVMLPAIWSAAFYNFFVMTQSFLVMIVLAIVAPPLISRDVRNRAFLVYFSKPIGVWEYLLGKLGTVLFFIFVITLFPALFLYAISIALAPDMGTLVATAPILPRIVAAGFVIGVPLSAVSLLISSMTREHRIAAFLWIALWILGDFAYLIVNADFDGSGSTMADWSFLGSLRGLCTSATASVFGLHSYAVTLFDALLNSGGGQVLASGLEGPLMNDTWRQALDEARGVAEPPAIRPSTVAIGALALVTAVCSVWIRRRVLQPVRI